MTCLSAGDWGIIYVNNYKCGYESVVNASLLLLWKS